MRSAIDILRGFRESNKSNELSIKNSMDDLLRATGEAANSAFARVKLNVRSLPNIVIQRRRITPQEK